MKKLSLVLMGLWAPLVLATERGEISQLPASGVAPACEQAIAQLKSQVSALEALPLDQASVPSVLLPWNTAMGQMIEFWGGVGLIANVHPDSEIRAANEKCELKITQFINEIGQRGALYARLKAVKAQDAIDGQTLKDLVREFEDKGVNLPKVKRDRVAAIYARLAKLEQDFARNVRENKQKLAFTEAELAGVPSDTLKGFARNAKGEVLIGFDYPEYLPVMENAESGEVRRQLYTAYQKRGSSKNLAILQEVSQLRKQLASLMGLPSFAHLVTRGNMAGSPEAVHAFLAEVKGKVTELERKEVNDLAQEKAKHLGQPSAKLERWDQAFYESRLKKARYQVDQEEVRAAFPTEATVNWMMDVTSRLYGVQFKANPKLPVWHADVKGYDIFDSASGEYRSSFYLDLFPRDGKYKHAAAFPVRASSSVTGSMPISALVTNFNRQGFDQEELETLFHEFGHIMHGTLSRTRYTLNAGTSTKRDFVEAPSQMFEEWARNPAALALWNELCASCKPIDMALVNKINESRKFGRGLQYARQWLYAAYDMALAGPQPQKPLPLWVKMEKQTPLGYVKGTEFPGAFGHIVGGYAAGYYGYMWSEVLALDMRSAFGSNFMDTTVGKRFRSTVLENGSQLPEMQSVRNFLGRGPNSQAFFREITGQSTVAGGQ